MTQSNNASSEFEISYSNPLLYRRQYVIAPIFLDKFEHWKKISLSENIKLTLHPDNEFTEFHREDLSLFMIGFLLNPKSPSQSNLDILTQITENTNSFEQIIQNTFPLGGKWIIICKKKDQIIIFNDPMGTKQVHYHHTSEGKNWISSQPHLIAESLNIPKTTNPEKLDFFKFRKDKYHEFGQVGDGTFYDTIFKLLPNRFYDFETGKIVRFFPLSPVPKQTPKQAIPKIAELLKGTMKSANQRYNLSLPVTAGRDSRGLLGASKDILNNVYCFLQKPDRMPNDHPDLKISKQIFEKINYEFHYMKCQDYDENFNELLLENVRILQVDFKKYLIYNFYQHFQEKLNVSGNAGESLRGFYKPQKNTITAEILADLYNVSNIPFAIDKFNIWLSEAQKIADKTDTDILDLFYWEQRMANWGVTYQACLDIATEELYPYNNREMIRISWGLSPSYRKKKLFPDLVKFLWKDLASFPYNPRPKKEILIHYKNIILGRIVRTLESIGIYKYIRPIKQKIGL